MAKTYIAKPSFPPTQKIYLGSFCDQGCELSTIKPYSPLVSQFVLMKSMVADREGRG